MGGKNGSFGWKKALKFKKIKRELGSKEKGTQQS